MRNQVVAALVVTVICLAIYLTVTTAVVACASMFVMVQP